MRRFLVDFGTGILVVGAAGVVLYLIVQLLIAAVTYPLIAAIVVTCLVVWFVGRAWNEDDWLEM